MDNKGLFEPGDVVRIRVGYKNIKPPHAVANRPLLVTERVPYSGFIATLLYPDCATERYIQLSNWIDEYFELDKFLTAAHKVKQDAGQV